MTTIQQTFLQIIELSKKLNASDENWVYTVNEPVSEAELPGNKLRNGAILPEAYAECMKISNGFKVDFSSSVGYFSLDPVKDFDIKDNSICIGWINRNCLYFNPQNGEFVIEYQRYNYTPVNDFNNEILVPVVKYLERQLILSERRYELLKKQENNPLRKYFDKFIEYRDNEEDLVIYPPLTEEEINDWEETHVKLPETYRNWLLLTSKCYIGFKDFYDLEQVNLEEVCWSENDDENKKYWFLATTTGYGTYLLLDPENGKLFEFDHEDEDPWNEIDTLDMILEDALDELL